jgi:hypothetical protein
MKVFETPASEAAVRASIVNGMIEGPFINAFPITWVI